MILYADDSVIFASSTFPQACQIVTSDLLRVHIWCKYHKLSMNASTTKSMYFSVRPSENIDDINIQLLDNVIEYVNVYKYLGIQLDPKLSFNNQYNETYKLASYKLLLLKRVRPVITEFTALTIVKTMLLPYLDMGNLFFLLTNCQRPGEIRIRHNFEYCLKAGIRCSSSKRGSYSRPLYQIKYVFVDLS